MQRFEYSGAKLNNKSLNIRKCLSASLFSWLRGSSPSKAPSQCTSGGLGLGRKLLSRARILSSHLYLAGSTTKRTSYLRHSSGSCRTTRPSTSIPRCLTISISLARSLVLGLVGCSLILLFNQSNAQGQPASLPAITGRPGQVIFEANGIGHRLTAWMNGLWYIPGIQARIYDLANPAAPRAVYTNNNSSFMNGHNWCVVNGQRFKRWYDTPETQGQWLDIAQLPAIRAGSAPNGVPWCTDAETYPYSFNFGQLYASQGGDMGDTIIIGNLLVFTFEGTGRPVVVYDIGNPQQVRLLGNIPTQFSNYTSSAKIYKHNVLLIGNEGGSKIHGVNFAAMIREAPESDRPVYFTIDDFQGRYIQFQDNFGFGNSFGGGRKVNMDTGRIELTWKAENGMDFYWMPVGNLVLGSGSNGTIDGDRSSIVLHQAEPDRRAPTVGFHYPLKGAKNLPVTSRVGLVIHETLEPVTVNPSNLIIRPVGGSPIGTMVTYKDNDVINVAPLSPLLPNTTYEFVLPGGGIRDAAGNGIQPFCFRFSTGNSLQGSPDCGAGNANASGVNSGAVSSPSTTASQPLSDFLTAAQARLLVACFQNRSTLVSCANNTVIRPQLVSALTAYIRWRSQSASARTRATTKLKAYLSSRSNKVAPIKRLLRRVKHELSSRLIQ